MTEIPIADMPRRMGRPSMNAKPTMVRLNTDIRERIVALVGPNRMAEFIRDAVERELKRRERKPKEPE